MLEITVRQLHMKTGHWVRKAVVDGPILVMDRSGPVAKLVAYNQEFEGKSFADRRLVKGFAALPKVLHDSKRCILEDRERA